MRSHDLKNHIHSGTLTQDDRLVGVLLPKIMSACEISSMILKWLNYHSIDR